jgi:putative transposase
MEADFCIEELEEALAKHGKPKNLQHGSGSQFTSAEFTGMPVKSGIAISHWIAIGRQGFVA